MIERIGEPRDLGVRVSIDDFGTGRSSLAELSKPPIDEIKIDRVFVRPAISDPINARICRNVIELAQTIGARVTAEGVEAREQAEWLRGIGCEPLKGCLFDRPAPSAEFEVWLAPGANGLAMMEPAAIAAGARA